mgnify:CR=1 FL=1
MGRDHTTQPLAPPPAQRSTNRCPPTPKSPPPGPYSQRDRPVGQRLGRQDVSELQVAAHHLHLQRAASCRFAGAFGAPVVLTARGQRGAAAPQRRGDEAGGTERGGAVAAWRSGPGPAPPGGAGWERNEEGARRSGPSLSSAGAAPGAAAAPPPCGAGGWRAGAATAAPALVFVSGPGGPLAAAAAPPSAGVRTPRLARPPGPGLTAQAPPPWRSSPRLRVPG